ncbi:Polypeptide N-acetylgalactosaminyltransferase 18 [Collichthys lucidus]|uniref:Polypeptide N-acetylgalactosaminyltransferase 18 n=1 Tax=Collichthys lucidus TaxID=240159 RepID=A0A4U5UEI4_COLLU|nr:Polypeptide N-acetylgalactosaminyltransferase 18 [Collichthys lucidus]
MPDCHVHGEPNISFIFHEPVKIRVRHVWTYVTAPTVDKLQPVWQCGGSVEVLPCSRIAHIERAHKPYTENLTAHVRRNALRVAEVWMDQYKSHVYMAWNVPLQELYHKSPSNHEECGHWRMNSGIDIGDISKRKALRSRLQCRPFSWFLSNIYPELRSYSDTVAYGVLKNSLRDNLCLDQGPDTDNVPIMYLCHGMTPQPLDTGMREGSLEDEKERETE